MNYQLRRLEKEIIEFVKQSPHAIGMLLLSPTTRNRDNFFSTSKSYIYLRNPGTEQDFITEFEKFIRQKFPTLIFSYFRWQGTIIINDNLTKMDFFLSLPDNLEKDAILLDISEKNLTDNTLAVDKDNTLITKLQSIILSQDFTSKKIQYFLDNLLVEAYNFSNYYTKKDFFRAYDSYMRMIDAFSHLNAILPQHNIRMVRDQLLYDTMLTYWEKDIYHEYNHDHTLEYLKTRYDLLISRLSPVVGEIERLAGVKVDHDHIKKFLTSLEKKFYPILNFRDIALIPNYCEDKIIIRPGLIFRSAMPEFSDASTIQRIIQKYNIKVIIDLREEDFHEYFNIPAVEIKNVERIHIPISYVQHEKTIDFVGDNSFFKNLYYGHLEFFARQIGQALEAVNTGLNKGNVLIHCTAGKDRTGIIAAFLQKIAGVSNKCIMADYLASFSSTDPKAMEYFIWLVENHYQGWQTYLTKKAGLSPQIIQELQEKIKA